MEPYAGMFDILLGYDTDIHFENDDLMTCTGVDYIEREIYKVLITQTKDWKLSPNLGCGFDEFIGQPNTRELGQAIQEKVNTNISYTVSPAQVSVRVVPTAETTIMCFIDIYMFNINVTTIPFQMEFSSGKIVVNKVDKFIDTIIASNRSSNNLTTSTRPNKYWQRMR